jgi:hypothetical protein
MTISCAEAAHLMVTASVADVETRDGGTLEVWTINSTGDVVHASGPRLQLWGGMQVWWRFLDEQGTPYRAEVHIVESRFKSDSRASLILRVAAVVADTASRLHQRCAVTGSASLTAVNCDRIVDTDQLQATFHDLSQSGAALIVADGRVRVGDRFLLRTRFIEGTIETDVRIARVLRTPGSQGRLVGAFFLEPTPQLAAIVEQVMTRFGQHRHTAGGRGIRESLGIDRDLGTPGQGRVTAAGPAPILRPGIA